MLLADTHAHLSDPQFDSDRVQVIERARRAGVVLVVDVGSDVATSERAVALAAEPGVWAAVGIHPHNARGADAAALARIEEFSAQPGVVAVGETGLDFYRDHSPRSAQIAAFEAHLALAHRVGKPVVVHSREADAELMARLRPWAGKVRAVLHCFSGSEAMLEEAVQLGFSISFAGTVTYPKAERQRSLVRLVPQALLLAETDCPYLAPMPRRGQRNEPAYVAHTVSALAEARGVPVGDLATAIFENAEAFFGIARGH
ncbi:MAG: TatD family hydrolase [Anaerolineae bacterium]|nr:TatD family hydrolase [Anaerolineae bacterium]